MPHRTASAAPSQLPLIQAIQDEEYWTDITLPMVEEIRRKLRDLVRFIERKARSIVYTDLPDTILTSTARDLGVPVYQTGFSPGQYRKKVQKIVLANENHVAIAKLKRNQALTETDLEALEAMLFDPDTVGTRAQFEQVFGKDPSLPRFIRQLVGLDRNAAKAAFAWTRACCSSRRSPTRTRRASTGYSMARTSTTSSPSCAGSTSSSAPSLAWPELGG